MFGQIHHLRELLIMIGLKEKEIDIYLHLLARGPSFTSTISRIMELPRSTTHNCLSELVRRNIIQISNQAGFRLYRAQSPENLYLILQTRYERFTMGMRRIRTAMANFTPITSSPASQQT